MTEFWLFAPGSRRYDNGGYANQPGSFANVSITGTRCQCRCAHCRGTLLQTMLPAETPAELVRLAAALHSNGCRGLLISGGADASGRVPLREFTAALRTVAGMGLAVTVHSGLLDAATAGALAGAGLRGVALDLIGDAATIREVYHLDKTPDDYRLSLRTARQAGLPAIPHIVAGMHWGRLRGEFAAVRMVATEGADALIFVVLMPQRGTAMQDLPPPDLAELAGLFAFARSELPRIPLILGCARPVGDYARAVERLAVTAGFQGIAFPAAETVDYLRQRGYQTVYRETCCGIM